MISLSNYVMPEGNLKETPCSRLISFVFISQIPFHVSHMLGNPSVKYFYIIFVFTFSTRFLSLCSSRSRFFFPSSSFHDSLNLLMCMPQTLSSFCHLCLTLNFFCFDTFQDSSLLMLPPRCPFTRAPLLAASRTSTRFSVCLVQQPRRRSRKPTTRSGPAWRTLTTCVGSLITNCWQWVCVCCPSDGQKVSPWYQQRWPASQGKICSAGRSLWGLVSFFLQAFPWSTVGRSFILSDFLRLLRPFPVFMQVLSDEGKRKQYDTYGSAGFEAGQAGGGQHYWSGQTSSMNPEELFRKIFGEFSGARGFGDFNGIFDQPQEVRHLQTKNEAQGVLFRACGHLFLLTCIQSDEFTAPRDFFLLFWHSTSWSWHSLRQRRESTKRCPLT